MVRKANASGVRKLFGHVLPAALPPPSTGSPGLDALATARRRQRSIPGAEAEPGDEAALAALLAQPEAHDFGVIPPWEEGFDRAGAAERRARQQALDLVYAARNEREQYFSWLVGWASGRPAGRQRLRELLGDRAVNERAKAILARQLLPEHQPHRPEDLAAVAALWEQGVTDLALVPLVLMAAVEQDLPGSFRRFSPLLEAGPDRRQLQLAGALLGGLRPLGSQLPSEWGTRLVEALGQERLAIFVPPVLAQLPREPAYLPPLLRLIQRFVTPEGLACIARHGDRRATGLLIRKLGRDTPHWDKLLEACRAVGDPALIPALRQWTEKQRTLGANAEWSGFAVAERLIAELQDRAEESRVTGKHLALVPAPKPPRAAPPRGRAPALRHRRHPPLKQQRAELLGRLKELELGSSAEALIREGWVMRATRVEEDALPLGGTRIGGLPDLPKGIGWPAIGDRALSFAAQVRLSEVAGNGLLPSSGLLSFFVLDEWADGEAPGYLQQAVVVLIPELTALRRAAIPKNFQSRRDGTMEERRPFASCLVEWVKVARLPAATDPQLRQVLSPAELKRYEPPELDGSPAENQLLGWRDRRLAAAQPPGTELLLRLTSDEQAGMEWGDGDALDFYSPREALLRGDFSQVFPACGD